MSHRILIVDDEPMMLEILSINLGHQGFTVNTASSMHEAHAKLMADELPDAIIVGDLKPLEEASQSLVLDIKTLSVGLKLPVIMLTTQARPEQIRDGYACGADDYITKPFSPRTLVTTLKKHLDARSIV